MFLGYWFICKAMWASRASIKSNAESLKKFYAFMVAKGRVTQEDLPDLRRLEQGRGDPEGLAEDEKGRGLYSASGNINRRFIWGRKLEEMLHALVAAAKSSRNVVSTKTFLQV
jgi:site-specific recombinase XerD